jgi:argininosuccinate lyase
MRNAELPGRPRTGPRRPLLRERFRRPPHPESVAFGSSIAEDAELLTFDLLGSLAHARGLVRAGLLPMEEGTRLVGGLRSLLERAEKGRFSLDPRLEDVHMNVEAALTAELGPTGERLHTGRSRNDQVATDLALYLRSRLADLEGDALRVAGALLDRAEGPEGRQSVPGLTHLQEAQRVHRSQLLQVHASRFLQDASRLAALRVRSQELCPLGSGALAGSSLPLDRSFTAELLGFRRYHPNSLEAVADRDPGAEALFAVSLIGLHISSLAEELVLGSMKGSRAVELDDGFVTTSSLMPHKRNPDLAELLRAESGALLGSLVAYLTVLKALPLSYNRDLQRLKPLLFEGVRRTRASLAVLEPMVRTARFLPPVEAGREPTFSVELVDALVLKGVPFREAHGRVARFLAGDPSYERGRLLTVFPELAPEGWTPPTVQEEPERRISPGGSSWREVLKDRARLRRELRRETARLRSFDVGWRRLRRRLIEAPVEGPSRPTKGF